MIQFQSRKIKDNPISDNEIISKIVMEAPKMYMLSIRVLQITKGLSLDIEDIKEECVNYIEFSPSVMTKIMTEMTTHKRRRH